MSKIKLYCRPKCGICKGIGGVIWGTTPVEKECITCGGLGYTDSVMTLEDEGKTYYHRSGIDTIYIPKTVFGEPIEIRRLGDNKLVTDSLNPTHLEVITLKECPKCEGGMIFHSGVKLGRGFAYKGASKCKNCDSGKIKVVTLKILFKPDEYDEEMIDDFLFGKREELKEGE